MLVKDLNEIAVKNGTSIKRMRNAIDRTIGQADPHTKVQGIQWYINARNECVDLACESPYTLQQVAGAMAHLSPRMPWSLNVQYTKELVHTGSAPVMSRSLNNAKLALISPDPLVTFSDGSRKTRNFYKNLTGDLSVVTVDSWAAGIAIPDQDANKILGRKGMYEAISHAYKLAGNARYLFPAEAQAVAWCVARGTHE